MGVFKILWAEYVSRLVVVSAFESSESSGWPTSARIW